ncbi:hypothetical protein LTR17_025224 [Elasticomyces elasticus]|nr:hypothetical protein LTR17_025224 [Elasticomyces elasticus]
MAAVASSPWAHAVPMDETNGFSQPQRTETLRSMTSTTSTPNTNKRSASNSRRPSAFDIASDSEAIGTRKASIRASNNSSVGRKRSRNTLRDKKDAVPEANVDDSAWIHRDKLAQIEIQEMEEAGIPYVRQSRRSSSTGPGSQQQGGGGANSARTSRSASRTGGRRAGSRERHSDAPARPGSGEQDGQGGPLYGSFDEYQHRKRVSTIPAADDEEEREQERMFDGSGMDTELRTPEEVSGANQLSASKQLRPSTSRIPISKASPVPVPQQVVDRESPMTRSRGGSGAWSGAWDEMQYARRSSIGSQGVLDDAEGGRSRSRPTSSYLQQTSGIENSPPAKARLPGKPAPTSAGRKVSGPAPGSANGRPTSSHYKPRTSSLATKARPGSSSGMGGMGHKSRPSTSSHAPEGEAPWIASMYKPDPRLPPDQQLLPTHAKRLMQEQWEKNGTTGTAYDRDGNLLNDSPFPTPQKPGLSGSETVQSNGGGNGGLIPMTSPQNGGISPASSGGREKPWPLSSQKSDTKSETGSLRPGTSGGYKITPTIAAVPDMRRSPVGNSGGGGDVMAATPRLPDYDEKEVESEKTKKSCGCCIIM